MKKISLATLKEIKAVREVSNYKFNCINTEFEVMIDSQMCDETQERFFTSLKEVSVLFTEELETKVENIEYLLIMYVYLKTLTDIDFSENPKGTLFRIVNCGMDDILIGEISRRNPDILEILARMVKNTGDYLGTLKV